MELFEIHITGTSPEIIDQFKGLNIKTLEVELLDPNKNIVGKEYMCSHVVSLPSYENCKGYVQGLLLRLTCEIARIKIETPYQEKYVQDSIYAECHFPTIDFNLPTVRNVNSDKFVSTQRTYNKNEYTALKGKYSSIKGAEFELCLLDSNTDFDNFWLSHYK